MTMIEHGKADNPVVAYVGDGNNMTHSWMWLAAKLGFELRVATPPGYEADGMVIHETLTEAQKSGAKIAFFHDPEEAVRDADVITTDTWISMGQEEEKEQRIRDFNGFIVDDAMMALAKKDAIFLHCLPAYRGYEVSEAVLEGPQSVIFDEAENRLHAQKGLMVWLDKQRNKD
jgi:ornithine carbamoyltransferase